MPGPKKKASRKKAAAKAGAGEQLEFLGDDESAAAADDEAPEADAADGNGGSGEDGGGDEPGAHDGDADSSDGNALRARYSDWFLDYASYVILERAVPHLDDGLKPVQRRILHAMWEKEDGRYNKVANLVGHTMQYHPHGDASIGDALVQLGQKELLIDTQGNWGNILTGDSAAAPRYIEARLSKFALDVVFSPKITEWIPSYDGRNKEPLTLPMKFPLLLAQGAEGIAVGLSCRILPHNFIELIDACIAALRKEPFEIYPDFPQGGIADVSEYNDGLRGGRVRVRARIEPGAKKSILEIKEIPFGTTTGSLVDSILKANDKGKIKIAHIDDMTAENVDIRIHLPAGADQETMIQALYTFTDCEVSIAPNACVISDNKPQFLPVSKLLKASAERTRDLLRMEQEIRLGELQEKLHYASLEKIFIENRIYRDIEECETWEAVMAAIWKGMKPHLKGYPREVTDEDIARLTEIKIKRISKYNTFEAEEYMAKLRGEIGEVEKNIRNITRFTIRFFEELKKKYGKGRERKTELAEFERVAAREVAVANETLYLNAEEGFAGYALRKDAVAVEKCSRLDDIIVFGDDGTMKVMKVADKAFVGKKPVHVAVFRKDEDKVYTLFYRDGRGGKTFAKRFKVGGVTRDKLYDLAQGKPGTKVLYFAIHDSEADSDAQKITVFLKPALRLRNLEIEMKMKEDLAIKGRGSRGNIVTKQTVARIRETK